MVCTNNCIMLQYLIIYQQGVVRIMILETERLFLKPWDEDFADDLYEYAKDPLIGPSAGWLPHESAEESREIIREILKKDENYAVVLKENNKVIGSVGLIDNYESHLAKSETEAELGYWIGVPYWGKGLIPEASNKLIERGFIDLGLTCIWCGYFDENTKSKKVQEKCGFKYNYTIKNAFFPLINQNKEEHVTCLTKEDWLKLK